MEVWAFIDVFRLVFGSWCFVYSLFDVRGHGAKGSSKLYK